MALDPKMLESLPDTLVDLYGVVEIDILSDMARRISSYDYFIPAALHQNQKLQELGMVQEEIIKRLSALTGQTQAEIIQLLSDASAEAVEDDIDYYTRAEVYEPSKVDTEALYAQLNSGLLQTEQAFFNITRTTANTATKQFERALDRAWLQISTGAFDYNTAVKRAILDLAEQGLGAIEYKSGRVDSIEVAVRRAVVTGANQTALKTQEVLADELEIDLVEVSAHGGARPDHAKWQGKVFSRNGRVTIDGVTYEDFRKATGYGTGAGLGGWNCRHTFFPYVPGASRSWTDKELKALEKKDIEYNGEKYTEYEASQIQRGIERDIRKHKRTVAAIEATGGDASEERAKLRKAQKSYTDFSEQTGMKKQSARTQIASKKAQRAAANVNTKPTQQPNQQPLTSSGNSGIILSPQADQNIETVKTQTWYDKDVKQQDKKEVLQALENTTDGERKFWAAHGGKVKGDLYTGRGYYDPRTKTIHITLDRPDERSKRVGYSKDVRLLFHETGHLFDYNVMSDGSRVKDHLPDLRKLLRADAIAYINKIFAKNSLPVAKKLNGLSSAQRNAVFRDLFDDRHLKNAVSDLFGGLSGGQLQGAYGHSQSYWRGDSLETEAIAHMFEAKFMKGERLDAFKKYFPNAYQYFANFIETEIEDKL